jgi:hypothetical protein
MKSGVVVVRGEAPSEFEIPLSPLQFLNDHATNRHL